MNEIELLKKLNDFYIYANEGLYVDEIIKKDKYTMVYSKYVKDYDSNYVINIDSNTDFKYIEKDVRAEMKRLNRTPCYIITPVSNIYKDRELYFDKRRYEEVNNEIWQVYENFQNIDKIDSKCYLSVSLEKTNDMEKLAEITYKSFCTGDELDPYGDFDRGYIDLYKNYNNENESKYTREFYFIKVNGRIVGCTVNVYDNEIFGIYGIAVMKEYRGKGIGTEAIKQQLQICRDKNKKMAFLQTEEGFYPANLYRKIGFKDVCNVFYYIEKN